MPLVLLALVLFLVLATVLMIPLSIVQRYRMGKARRTGRGWIAAMNVMFIFLSAGLFLYAAAITNIWVPNAFTYSLAGLAVGGILGLLGLVLTRWEETPKALYYTPNRWLILFITFAVAARLLYGFWRGWHAWGSTAPGTSWLAEVGVAKSMAVGAVVLGYYFIYWAGVWRRLRHHRMRAE